MKKNFCDVWDNLLSVIITNIIFMVFSAGIIYLWALVVKALGENALDIVSLCLTLGTITVWNIIHSIISLAFGETAVKICDFKSPSLADFFKNIPSVLKDGLCFGLLVSVFMFLSGFCLYYYYMQGSLVGIFFCALIFWIDMFVILSLQFFTPIRCTMHNNFWKCIKKCFIVFFDNTGFSLLVALNNLFIFALSIVFFGFIPSLGAIVINMQNNFRIRLYKYDYLEEHPELKTKKERKQIPWEDLIYEDRENLGPRTFKSFIFPWKE